MDFDPAEIKKMMEHRQRELRGQHSASNEPFQSSPTKRSRGEKENKVKFSASTDEASSPVKVQGFMAKFAVSPKSVRRNAAGDVKSPTVPLTSKTRFSELSKRYAEMEDELPPKKESGHCVSTTRSTEPKKQAPPIPQEKGEGSSSEGVASNTKRRAPSPPPKGKTTDSPLSPSAKSSERRWQVVERTTVTIRHGSTQSEEQQSESSGRQRGKDSAMSFAQAQALAKAREEAFGDQKSAAPKDKPDPSLAKVADKAKNFEKAADNVVGDRLPVIPKSKVVPRGKIADKVSQFDVGSSGPRCVIETKPLGSVSSRAKFFEKAMEDDRKAADAVYIPVNQRIAKELEKEDRASRAVKPVVCKTPLSPTKKPLVVPQSGKKLSLHHEEDETIENIDEAMEFTQDESSQENIEEESLSSAQEEESIVEMAPPVASEKFTSDVPKKIGQVSNKLKNRLEDMMVYGHQTPDETIISISERSQIVQEHCGAQNEDSKPHLQEEPFLTPRLPRKSEHLLDEDTISRITGIPEDGHSTPLGKGTLPSSEETFGTPLTKTMSQYRREERQAVAERDVNVKRIVYQIPSNMMEELRRGKDAPSEEESLSSFEAYKRQTQEEILKQESIMKQTSHALAVCQENGDRGSEQHVEAERLLLISTQRHQAAHSELQRLNVQKSIPQPGGTLTLCDIKLPFKKEFLKLLRSCNDLLESTHYFIVLVRSGASLLHTELVSTNEKVHGGAVHLTHHMVLKNLQEGFRVFVEVYAVEAPNRNHPEYEISMKKIRREKEKEHSSHKGGILSAFTPSKKKPPTTPGGNSSGSSDDGTKLRRPSFGLIGRVTLDERLIALKKDVHYLDNYYNESPLDGRIVMKIQLNMPPKVTHCGMLRLKDSNGMFGSVDFIKSFFAAIEGGRLNLWNDMRDAEDEQEPLRSFDLSQAVDTVKVDQSFNFFYFSVRMNNGIELLLLTYSEAESRLWADKLNESIATARGAKY